VNRFFSSNPLSSQSEPALDSREEHHALRVLRVREGEEIQLLDGAGSVAHCRVRDARKTLRLEVISRETVPPLPCAITLVQALPKGKAFESILQKAAELGAHQVVPLLTERVISQFDAESVPDKLAKWRQVTIEAIKQCGTPWLPIIARPIALAYYLRKGEKCELSLVGSLHPGAAHPRESFTDYHARHGSLPSSVSVWVGPEGDFTPAEVEAIVAHGARPISLGRFVLRSETAAVYCLSICNYELQGAVETTPKRR
jgi:16S rRNA (uracil1498-N3)-methyltransferase